MLSSKLLRRLNFQKRHFDFALQRDVIFDQEVICKDSVT